jgi:YidC/Oxa1 family membrane protein insertase
LNQEKRLFLAMVLCVLVFVGFQFLFPAPKKPPAKPKTPVPGAPGAVPVPAPAPAGAVPPAAEGAARVVPAEAPPVAFVSGRVHTSTLSRGASLGRAWLEGVESRPGSDPSSEAEALAFLEVPAPDQPGAFSVSLASPDLELADIAMEPWELVSPPGKTPIVYRARALKRDRGGKGIVVEKRFLPAPGKEAWHFRMEVSVLNEDPELAGKRLELRVRGSSAVHAPEGSRDAILGKVKIRNTSSTKDMTGSAAFKAVQEKEVAVVEGDIEWVAVTSTYFAVILDPDAPSEGEPARPLAVRWDAVMPAPGKGNPRPAPLPSPVLSLPLGGAPGSVPRAGVPVTAGFTVFVGPTANGISVGGEYVPVLDRDEEGFPYAKYKPAATHSFFFLIDIIAEGLLYLLKGFHALLPNWGVAIVLLTVLVRGALYPLSKKSLRSTIEYSQKMQKIKPKLEALKSKHGDDRRKISEEQFRLMKEHDVPLLPGGCLITFLQLPIWWALYQMLQTSFDLRHAPFLWVEDLSQADRLWHMLPGVASIPMVPNALEWLNLLPLLMTATWFFSSKATMTPPADEQQAQMQAMMQWMPFIMLLFPGFYTMPAGLCLYITASSTWGIVESRIIRKKYGAAPAQPPAPPAPAGAGGR